MGWAARNKGTYEERKAKAIERGKDIITAREEAERKRLADMSPEEKKRRARALNTMLLATFFRGF